MPDDDTLPGLEPDADLPAPDHAGQQLAGDDDQLPALELPGLEADQAGDGDVLKAARRSLRALEQAGVFTDAGAVMGAALVTTARQLDRAVSGGRAKDYGVAQLVAQLRETWSVLVPDETGNGSDGFDQLAAELREAAANARRQPVDGPL